jgi:hypothetical protein
VAPNPRNHDFATRRFEHGSHHEVMKHEITKNQGSGPVFTAHSHIENGAIKKGMHLLGGWRLRLFGEKIMAIKFKIGSTIDLDGPFHKFKYRDIWN